MREYKLTQAQCDTFECIFDSVFNETVLDYSKEHPGTFLKLERLKPTVGRNLLSRMPAQFLSLIPQATFDQIWFFRFQIPSRLELYIRHECARLINIKME